MSHSSRASPLKLWIFFGRDHALFRYQNCMTKSYSNNEAAIAMNSLFSYLLQGLGFNVSICNAQLCNSRGFIIPNSQHMVLIVKLEQFWLVDVGYGNGFLMPLLLESFQPQKQGNRSYRLVHRDSKYVVEGMNNGTWQSWYAFTREPKQISDFEDRNRFHQTDRDSTFFEKRICMIMREDEAIELNGNQLIRKTSSKTFVTIIEEEKIPHLLQTDFGIKLEF
jgi:N-hydroxyarylamine O-acetyltransferase